MVCFAGQFKNNVFPLVLSARVELKKDAEQATADAKLYCVLTRVQEWTPALERKFEY